MRLIVWQRQGLKENIELLPGATAPGSDELAPGSDELSTRSRVAIHTIRGTGRQKRLHFCPGQEPEEEINH